MVSQSSANSKTLNILINSGTQARSNAMGGGGDAGREDRKQAQADKKNFDSLRSGTKDMYDMFKKRVPPLNSIFKKMGIEVGMRSILKQSQIFTSTVGSIFQILGALVDVTLAPFLPVIVPAIKKLGKLIPWWADKMNTMSKGLIDNVLKPTINAIRWIVNAWKKTLGKLPTWGQWILGIYMILLMRQGMGLVLKGLAKPSGAFGIIKRVLPGMGKNSAKQLTYGQRILSGINKSGKNLSVMANIAKGGKKALTLGGLLTGAGVATLINKTPDVDATKVPTDQPKIETPTKTVVPESPPTTKVVVPDSPPPPPTTKVKGTNIPRGTNWQGVQDDFIYESQKTTSLADELEKFRATSVDEVPKVNKVKWDQSAGGLGETLFENVEGSSKGSSWLDDALKSIQKIPAVETTKITKPAAALAAATPLQNLFNRGGGSNLSGTDDLLDMTRTSTATKIPKPKSGVAKIVASFSELGEVGAGVSKAIKPLKPLLAVAGPGGIALETMDAIFDYQENSRVLEENRKAAAETGQIQGAEIGGKDMGTSAIGRNVAAGADVVGIAAPIIAAAATTLALPAVVTAAVAGLAVSELGQIFANKMYGEPWDKNTLMGIVRHDDRSVGQLPGTNPVTGDPWSGLQEFSQYQGTGTPSIVYNPQAATMGGWNQHDKYSAGMLEGPIDRSTNLTITIKDDKGTDTAVIHNGYIQKAGNTPSYDLEIGDW